MAKAQKITEFVSDVLQDLLKENGLEIYHVDYSKQGRDWHLNVEIDVSDGSRYVSTDDCELVSRYLSDKLDEKDLIQQEYLLEISSPGMDRQLYEPKDYQRFTGELVDVKLYKSIDKQKEFQGILVGLQDNKVIIKEGNNKQLEFPLDQVAKTSLAVVF